MADAYVLEKTLIALIGRVAHGGPLLNMTDGGEGMAGVPCPEDKRERMKARVGSSNPFFGRKHTPESLALIQAASAGENNPRYGKPGSRRGVKVSEETRAKMSAARLAMWSNPERAVKQRLACAEGQRAAFAARDGRRMANTWSEY